MRDKVKRFISILMTALMLVNLMPVGALADGITSGGYQQATVASTTYGAWVYVYAKLTGTVPGTTENAHGWYTLGKKWVDNMPDPSGEEMGALYGYGEISGVSVNSVINGMQKYTANENITASAYDSSVSGSGEFGFKICDGATDYVLNNNIKTWHLNLQIDVAKIQGKYTFHFKDQQGNKIKDSVTVTGKWNTEGSYTAPTKINYNGYVYKLTGAATKSYTFNTYQQEHTFYYYNTGERVPYTLKIYYYYESVSDVNLISKDVLSENPYTEDNIKYGGFYSVTSPTIIGYKPDKLVVDGWMPSHDVTVNVIYTRKNDLRYTVKYLETGTNKKLRNAKTVENQPLHKLVTEEAPDIEGYKLVSESPKSITIIEGTNEIIFYYEKDTFTIKYRKGDHAADTFTEQEYTAKYDDPTPTFTGNKDGQPGWKFDGWTPEVAETVKGTATYTAQWVPDTKQNVEVIYTTDGNGKLDKSFDPVTQHVQIVTGKVVKADGSVIGDDLTTVRANAPSAGYEFDHWVKVIDENNLQRIDAGSDLTNAQARPLLNQEDGLYQETVFKAIFRPRTDLSYTVNYYWNGTTTKVADSKTVKKQTFDSTVTESPIGADGYTPVSNDPKKITIGTGNNEITFYYYKNVELTANSDEKTYNGNEQTVKPGYTCSEKNVTFDNIAEPSGKGTDAGEYPVTFAKGTVGKVDTSKKYIVTAANPGTLTINKRSVVLTSETASKAYDGTALEKPVVKVTGDGFVKGEATDIKATGTITNVGSVTNEITFTKGEKFNEDNYAIEKKEGTLTITAADAEVIVTIAGNTDNVLYDGNSHSVNGYTVKSISSKLYTVDDFKFNGTDSVTQTNAGTYPMGLKAEQFSNNNENFKKVTFVVEDGSLTIRKRSVVLTSETASKEYDGTALEKPVVTVTGDGFVKGEVSDIKATGTITDVGSVTNEITFTKGEKFNEDNYAIEKKEGTLTITAADAEVIVTIAGNTDNVLYDGNSHSVNGYTVKSISSKLYTVDDFKFNGTDSVTQTNAGTYPMGLKAEQFSNNNENFKKVTFVVEDGSLTINKLNVVLTSETASKTYDGTALTKPIVKVTGDGFVAGEVSDIKATGSVTHVSAGEVTNTITYTEGTNFKESNYNITKTEGKLSITPLGGVVVTIKGQTKTVTYDGEEHTAWKYDVIDISDPLYIKAPDEVPNFWNKNAKGARGTDAGTYAMGWEAADFENTNTNFSNVEFVVVDGKLEISKRSVKLTSASDSKVYDGNALTNGEVTVSGDGFAKDEGATYNVTGSQTVVGTSDNTFTYTLNEGTKADNYTIEKTEGELEVTPVTDKVIVTITGKTKTVTYDGKEHSVFGYDVTVSNALYNPKKDMQFNGIDEDMTAKGTDAGTYPMGLEDSDFTNISDNFTNVEFVVTDGYVKINPRAVTLTSETAGKVYDGTALTKPEVAVGGDGFVDGEVTDIKATGSVTYVSDGEVTNTITYTEGEKFNADNYDIQKTEGKLWITAVTAKVTVTVKEKSGTATYDGMNHTVTGYESMTADNPLYDVEDSVDETPTANWAANGTDAGEYPVGIEAGDFENTNKNFSNVTFVVEDGSLTITPAPITLQASSRIKTYDGTPLKADGYGFSEGNLDLAKDIASVILTGSQTLVGSSESQITEVVLEKEKNPDNYKFTFLPGTLTVTDGTGEDEKPVDPAKVITKTHTPKDTGYNVGETVTFTVSVTNIYNEQKEVTLEEQPGVTFVDPQGAAIGTKATKTLEPGEKWTIQATYTITLDDILADGFTNKVKANFKGGKSWNAEDYVETRDPYIELDVTKTADVDKAALGQTITYTITVDYQSNVPGKKVEVKDPLTGLETSFTTEEALEGKTVTFTTTYTVTEQDVKNGIVKNTATVKSELDNEWMPADVETPTFAPITIKPKDVTATYNGAAITGKDVEITSGKLLEGHKLSAAVVGSGVNAGTYELTLDPEKIKIVDENNNDVSGMYERTLLPGKLTIAKRSVLITSQSATKTYDGSALTSPVVTITGDGFVPGELAKAEATGSITNVGSTPNTIQYTTTGAFNAANYSIALSVGTLTVTEKPKPEPRRTFNLTINYVYQNGKRAAASYNRGGLKNGETFDITSPVIAGYTASETVVSGTIYNRDIKVTVIYTADGVNLDDYGVPLGLGNITMNVGDCFE